MTKDENIGNHGYIDNIQQFMHAIINSCKQ